MRRLYRFLMPRDLGLTPEDRRGLLKDAIHTYHARGYACGPIVFVLVVLIDLGAKVMDWIVQSASWPEWVFYTMFGVGSVLAVFAIVWTDLLLGFRRAIYEALIRRGHAICPRCGYKRTGLASDCDCPECGANPDSERWEMTTLNLWERAKFRHIDQRLRLPFEVRRAVIRTAWYRLRQHNLHFSIYLLGVLLIVSTFVAGQQFGAWSVLGVVGGLAAYLWMEGRLIAGHVRAELRARGYLACTCCCAGKRPGSDAPCPECGDQGPGPAGSPPPALP